MSDILTHTDAGVMTITFNRLDKKNSITAGLHPSDAADHPTTVTSCSLGLPL